MSTGLLFKHPRLEQSREEVERQRDILGLRNAQLILVLQFVDGWLESGFAPNGVGVVQARIKEALQRNSVSPPTA